MGTGWLFHEQSLHSWQEAASPCAPGVVLLCPEAQTREQGCHWPTWATVPVKEVQPHGHSLAGGQHPWVRQAPPPHQGARCGGWPSAWCMYTEAALARHPRARLQWQQNLRELPWLQLQALEVAPGCPAPASSPPSMTCPRACSEPNGHPSHVWEAESERCALPLIAQLLFLLLTGLLTYCEYQERGTYRVVRCWKRCLTVYPYPLRLGGEPPQNGSCDGTMDRHPDLSPWAVWGQV